MYIMSAIVWLAGEFDTEEFEGENDDQLCKFGSGENLRPKFSDSHFCQHMMCMHC